MNFEISYLFWAIGILVLVYFLYKPSKRVIRGIINYRKLGKEEFMKRLKRGFEEISPLTKVKAELRGLIISIIGIVIGLIVVPIIAVKGFWYWIEIGLFGTLILTVFQLIGKIQEYIVIKKQDDMIKEIYNDEERNELENCN